MSEFFTTVARPVRMAAGRKREATPFDGYKFTIADENSAIACPVLVTAETRKLARQLRSEFKSQNFTELKLQTRFIGHGEDKLQLVFWCE